MRNVKSETSRSSIPLFKLPALLVLISALLLSLSAQAADPVGSLIFVRGDVSIVTADNVTKSARKGDNLMQGELVTTGENSVAVIQLSDDSRMVLRPFSEFRVERLVTEEDAADTGIQPSAVLNLLRGGIRLVTGLIGSLNPAGYRLNTPVATIGIRGTEFSTRLCAADCAAEEGQLADSNAAEIIDEGLYVSVDDGQVFLENDAPGEPLDLAEGESGYVADPNSLPVRLALVPAFLSLDSVPSPGQLDFNNIDIPDLDLQASASGADVPQAGGTASGEGDGDTVSAVPAGDSEAEPEGITGSYEIDVDYGSDLPLADRKWFFGTSPDIVIALTQSGNNIKGELSGDREGLIEGKIDDDTVTYKLWLEARGGEIKEGEGTWIVKSKDKLEGDFNIRDRERGIIRGDVTLTRVGTAGSSAFGFELLLFLAVLWLATRQARRFRPCCG